MLLLAFIIRHANSTLERKKIFEIEDIYITSNVHLYDDQYNNKLLFFWDNS